MVKKKPINLKKKIIINDSNNKNFHNNGKKDRNLKNVLFVSFFSLIVILSFVSFVLSLNNNSKILNIENFLEDITQGEYSRYLNSSNNKVEIDIENLIENEAYLGDVNAPITIVEFSDYECPFCKRFFFETYPKIKENYINTGKVKYVFKDFALDFHKGGILMAKYANCLRDVSNDETYFKFHDKLFIEQAKNEEEVTEEKVISWISEYGYDVNSISFCANSKEAQDNLEKDITQGINLGVRGTPTLIVGNEIIAGAQHYSIFEKSIESQL